MITISNTPNLPICEKRIRGFDACMDNTTCWNGAFSRSDCFSGSYLNFNSDLPPYAQDLSQEDRCSALLSKWSTMLKDIDRLDASPAFKTGRSFCVNKDPVQQKLWLDPSRSGGPETKAFPRQIESECCNLLCFGGSRPHREWRGIADLKGGRNWVSDSLIPQIRAHENHHLLHIWNHLAATTRSGVTA
jgi:hypothetical protein